jgi:hypothetical protein
MSGDGVELMQVRDRTRSGCRTEGLGDHAAHRVRDDMGGPPIECVEDRGGVVGHVFEPVGRGVGMAAYPLAIRCAAQSRRVDWPLSRLSNRATRNRCRTSAVQKSSFQ